MKSLQLIEPGKFTFQDTVVPTPNADEALVNVLACGVCGSDIHAMRGKQPYFSYPRRLGHELCVEIASAPATSVLSLGDKCVVEPYFYCGKCIACRHGKTNCCTNLSVLGIHTDGGHSPQITVPIRYLHKANNLTKEQASLVEPLAIGAHAISRASLSTGEYVVILGMGTIGIAAALFAKLAGVNLVVVDVNQHRVDFAKEKLGFDKGVLASNHLHEDLVKEFGGNPQCIIDATGNVNSMENCFDMVEYGGKIVFIGLFDGQLTFDDVNYHSKEITLMASRAALSSDFEYVIRVISEGLIDPTPMITERLTFDTLDKELLNVGQSPNLIKAIIDF